MEEPSTMKLSFHPYYRKQHGCQVSHHTPWILHEGDPCSKYFKTKKCQRIVSVVELNVEIYLIKPSEKRGACLYRTTWL